MMQPVRTALSSFPSFHVYVSFVSMPRWSSLVDHVPPFLCFPIDSFVSSLSVLVDSRIQLFSFLISGVSSSFLSPVQLSFSFVITNDPW
jgi:hypothetical protein